MVLWLAYQSCSAKNNVALGQKTRLTKRASDAWDSAQISGCFLRFSIFLAGRLRRPRPSAGNANRWAAGTSGIWRDS